jgi:hypothetical protein
VSTVAPKLRAGAQRESVKRKDLILRRKRVPTFSEYFSIKPFSRNMIKCDTNLITGKLKVSIILKPQLKALLFNICTIINSIIKVTSFQLLALYTKNDVSRSISCEGSAKLMRQNHQFCDFTIGDIYRSRQTCYVYTVCTVAHTTLTWQTFILLLMQMPSQTIQYNAEQGEWNAKKK